MTHGPATSERGADDEAPVAKDVAAPAAMRGAEGTGSPESTHQRGVDEAPADTRRGIEGVDDKRPGIHSKKKSLPCLSWRA